MSRVHERICRKWINKAEITQLKETVFSKFNSEYFGELYHVFITYVLSRHDLKKTILWLSVKGPRRTRMSKFLVF